MLPDTTYDRHTPVATYLRQRVNVAFFDSTQYPDPEAASCKYCHEQLIVVDDGANLLSQNCGIRKSTATPAPSNENSKESKLKQRDSLNNKSFIVTLPDKRSKQRSTLEDIETDEDLGALNYFSRMHGNPGDYSRLLAPQTLLSQLRL